MARVKMGSSVTGHMPIWRYISLDKLVNLLETESLYFTPLSLYEKSDPFEGYMPKVGLEALANLLGASDDKLEHMHEQLKIMSENSRNAGINNPNGEELLKQFRIKLDAKKELSKEIFNKTTKGITVNCWHYNLSESEAMWKLYSENGKGLAIKTSIASLKSSIESIEQDLLVHIGRVKYLDFYDENITPKDCVTDGHLSPLLKRASFSHENEIRLFTVPDIEYESLHEFEPTAKSVKISTNKLIEQIYISPYAGEPFSSSAIAICKKYGINPELIIESKLLSGHQELLDILATRKI
ncbi:DUF2971 domain-containing protein [Pseudomonas sp. XK-1]|uniref:DUF2971 domain-containing protein n=1 Tax=Pseudomonas sp. XK-1 TaxID=3136019 RepID=UPI00311A7B34